MTDVPDAFLVVIAAGTTCPQSWFFGFQIRDDTSGGNKITSAGWTISVVVEEHGFARWVQFWWSHIYWIPDQTHDVRLVGGMQTCRLARLRFGNLDLVLPLMVVFCGRCWWRRCCWWCAWCCRWRCWWFCAVVIVIAVMVVIVAAAECCRALKNLIF